MSEGYSGKPCCGKPAQCLRKCVHREQWVREGNVQGLVGDLQMQCESEGPTGPSMSGASCPATPAYAQSQVKGLVGGIDPAMKQMSGGPCKAPRQGANEMAQNQMNNLRERTEASITTELIRAREIGQREGREDEAKRVVELEKTIQQLLTDALLAKQIASRPIYFSVPDPRVYELQTKLTSLQYQFDASTRVNNTLQDKNNELHERNGWQAKQMEDMSARLFKQNNEIGKLKKCVDTVMHDNAVLTHNLEETRKKALNVVQVLRRKPSIFHGYTDEALCIAEVHPTPDGLMVIVA